MQFVAKFSNFDILREDFKRKNDKVQYLPFITEVALSLACFSKTGYEAL